MSDEKEKGPCAYCGFSTTEKDEDGNFKCSICFPENEKSHELR